MNIRRLFFSGFIASSSLIQCIPLVQSIVNDTDVGYVIVDHSDTSSCSLREKNKIIDAHGYSKSEFLLESNKQKNKPSLTLRPLYYYDKSTHTKMPLLDEKYNYDTRSINAAYQVWQNGGGKRKFLGAQDWFAHWIGQDIHVFPDVLEASGYLMNLSRIHIKNTIKEHAQWLSFSKGVFSRLMIEIDILQHERKGIKPRLKVIAGEGGVCVEGVVKRV